MTKRKIVNFSKTIYRGTKNSWKKYHFLAPPKVFKKHLKYLWNIVTEREPLYYDPFNVEQYNSWLDETRTKARRIKLKYKPLISVLIPVYNVEGKYLRECLDSILAQTYENFEICIVDDASTKKETIDVLRRYENNKKIKVHFRKKNGHISRATNDALKMASGEFVALMDNDDVIPKNALYEVAKILNQDKKIDMIYTDEDKINIDGRRCDPNFKSDWAPDSLLSSNYISHLGVLRKSIMDDIGGFRVGYEGAQDYDLYLRFTEKTDRICHIPKVLYHWRMIPGSTSMENGSKSYALERGKKAIEDALRRRKISGIVRIAEGCPYYYIEYAIKSKPKVSIIIPTRDLADITRKCLQSIYEKTKYKNYEVVVVNNNSEKEETFALFDEYKKAHDNFKIIDANFEFNYAKINNLAVKGASGDYLILLNNDVEVITPKWIEILLGYAKQKHIGAVGAKLIYPDDTVQHGGVILGLGVASHAYVDVPRDAIVWGGRLSVPYNYSAMTAACMMVEKTKWEEVNGMEEKLKVAYNDVDFCLKLLEKGYYNVFVPMVELYHYESKSRGKDNTSEKKKRFDFEQDYMRKKWKKRIDNDEFYNPNYSRLKYYKLDKKRDEK